jgi:glycosyltransferase involved in cell wall biosynthesis
MAAALPVVATDVGDVRGMLTDDNRRFVVPRDDEPAFTRALSTLLTNATLRRRLGHANRSRAVREYDETAMVATYDALFRSAILGTR